MIEQILLGFSNIFLIRGDKTIIVDTGRPGDEKLILQALKKRNISSADVSLPLLTHGHFDHFGSAQALREQLHVPVDRITSFDEITTS
ncbi:MBL fold metallo-hydrolase [Bacillus sp. C1]